MKKYWVDEEISFLKKHFEYFTNKQIGKQLNRSELSVMKKLQSLGLFKIGRKNKNMLDRLNALTDNNLIYFLGYFYADGHVTKNQNNIVLHIKYEDYENLENILNKVADFHVYIKEAVSIKSKITGKVHNHGKSATLIISNKEIKKWFKENGFLEKSTKTPVFLLEKLNKEQRRLFFRGFIDGDGSIGINKRGYPELSIYTNREHDLLFLEFLEKPYSFKKYIKNNGLTVKLLKKLECIDFFNWLYKDYDNIGLQRKYKKYKSCLEKIQSF